MILPATVKMNDNLAAAVIVKFLELGDAASSSFTDYQPIKYP